MFVIMRGLGFIASLAALSSLVVVACFGDDPVLSAHPPPDGGAMSPSDDGGAGGPLGEPDSGGSPAVDGSTGPADAGHDASVVCAPAETNCLGTCVDLTKSQDSCGACGHTCGGGACVESVCQPMVVRDALKAPVFDVDGMNIYFQQDNKVLSCPLGGCKSGTQPKQIAVVPGNLHTMMHFGGGFVFFMAEATSGTSGPNLYICPVATGCPAGVKSVGSAGHQSFGGGFAARGGDFYWNHYKNLHHVHCDADGCDPDESVYAGTAFVEGPIAADDAGVYFLSPGTTTSVVRCPKGGAGCAPSTVGTVPKAIVDLDVGAGKVWMLAPGGDGYTDGFIRTCPPNNPSCAGDLFAANQPYPSEVTVDENAVSWLNRYGSSGKPEIVTCAIGGCVGGPRTVAVVDAKARDLRSDDGFVYWATDTQLLRVAK